MSYSRRQLYAMGEPFGNSATRMEAGGRIVYGGGGGGGAPEPTTQITESGPTVTNTSSSTKLPGYINANTQDIVKKARAIGDTPYQAYTGQRVAEFTPDMLTAMERMRNQQIAPQIGEATGLASLAGQRAMDYGQFQTGVQQYMNPYMQNVVDIERRKAQEAADQQAAMLSGQAAKMGAFGGSGAALQQRALRRDTAQQLSDIQAQGLDRAYQSAVGQYNQGISSGLAAAGQLGGLGQQQFGQETDLIKNLGTSGDIQRQRQQALLDVGYGDFVEGRDWAARQLGLQKNLTSGLEYDTSTSSRSVQQPGKTVTQKVAAGGEIRSYADGGITSLLSDQQIAQRKQMPISDLARLALQAKEMENARLRAAQQNMMAQQAMMDRERQGPDDTVAADEMRQIAAIEQGIGGLEMRGDLVGGASMAGGGIVAFQSRGEVPAPYDPYAYGYTTLPAERQAELAGRAKAPTFSDINMDVAARARFKQMNGMPLTQEERAALVSPAVATPAPARFTPTDASDSRFARKPAPDMSGARGRQGIAQLMPTAERETQVSTADAGGESAAPSPKKRSSMLDDMYGPIEAEMRAVGAAERKALEDVEKDIKDEAKEGNSFADKARERLEARMKGLEGQDKVALENSILQFGLGLLTVKGAKDKAKALGELGLNTLKGHGDAMKDLQAKQERYEDAELELQKIELGERRATRKDLRDLQLKKAQAENGVRKNLAELLGKRADTVFDMYKLEETNRNALRVANARGAGGARGELTQAQRATLMNNAVRLADQEIEKDYRLKYSITPAERQAKRDAMYQQLLNAALGQDTMNQGTASTSAQDPLGLR